ncbi:hypothetical protein H5410_016857 [Solanum commersonii]|uniref:Uncharacterized protein n=1 Tax=Solanum commersonii TaxID=4109 RepID=A0A9J5ZXN6_SOLCO|nr:hypothetical protein H5410_016857 [Solanum commersonii]
MGGDPHTKNVEKEVNKLVTIIPLDCGLYACLFAKYISNGVFDMGLIHINAKYHRKRYATIMWQYGRSKDDDGTISVSGVTGMVASKFGGPA